MARAMVRRADPQWIRSIYSVALKPDAVFYLRLGIEQLVPRVVLSRGFDYWESGMDLYPGQDMYESFCNYQGALLAEFDRLSEEFKFEIVNAAADARSVFAQLKVKILALLENDSRKQFVSMLAMRASGVLILKDEEDAIAAAARKHSVTRDLELVSQPFAVHATPNGNGHGNGHGSIQHLKP
jgi:hypothetical protein